MSGQLVLMFPGQSSRYPGMIRKLADAFPAAAETLRRASVILGRDLLGHYRPDNAGIFASNRDVQIGVFLANHLHLELLKEIGITASWSLGLSLGEYNHLVHIGALDFDEALRLVDARGRLYDQAEGGLMVSLYPVEAAEVERIIAGLGLEGQVDIGLYNSPRQQVLSGARAAVEKVLEAIDAELYVEATPIEPRLAMHSPVFEPIGLQLGAVLAETPLRMPQLPYVPNVYGEVLTRTSPAQMRECLRLHAYHPVRWQASVDAVAARIAAPVFLETGPKAVLGNLFGRGWVPGKRYASDAAEQWPQHLERIAAEIRHVD